MNYLENKIKILQYKAYIHPRSITPNVVKYVVKLTNCDKPRSFWSMDTVSSRFRHWPSIRINFWSKKGKISLLKFF